jgi:hypothetical protein
VVVATKLQMPERLERLLKTGQVIFSSVCILLDRDVGQGGGI